MKIRIEIVDLRLMEDPYPQEKVGGWDIEMTRACSEGEFYTISREYKSLANASKGLVNAYRLIEKLGGKLK